MSTFPRHWHDPALDKKVSSSCCRLHSQRFFIRQKKIDVEYKELSRTLKGWCWSSINLTIISFMIARDNDCCYHALDSARYFFTIILRRLVPIGGVRILCSKTNWLVVDCLSNQFFKLLSWLFTRKRLLKDTKGKDKEFIKHRIDSISSITRSDAKIWQFSCKDSVTQYHYSWLVALEVRIICSLLVVFLWF